MSFVYAGAVTASYATRVCCCWLLTHGAWLLFVQLAQLIDETKKAVYPNINNYMRDCALVLREELSIPGDPSPPEILDIARSMAIEVRNYYRFACLSLSLSLSHSLTSALSR